MTSQEQSARDIVKDIYQEQGEENTRGTLDQQGVMELVTQLGYKNQEALEIRDLVMAITES
tara:strand:- start:1011 stop:1193 length:183 start_codon:yes stop_codon:yes gene_type:complete